MYEDRARLARVHAEELERYRAARPESERLWRAARAHLPGGVPMLWMEKWPGPWPVHVVDAAGAHFTCADGIDHVDLCLGDTGAMVGHAPAASVAAIAERLARGATFMLPTEDAAAAAGLLAERFGLPLWQFTLTATDANRHVLRYARAATGRSKVLVIDHCYHGTVDESYATLDDAGRVVARRGNIGAPVPLEQTTVVVPFNDVPALEAALAQGDVAAVLIEPAMTNIGIVLPDPGWHEAVRAACDASGTLLVIDETHTLCAGPGGMTARDGLRPDVVVVGKTIAGGVPAGAWGMTAELAERVDAVMGWHAEGREDLDVGGVGGTLAGNALSLAGIRATLSEVLTPEVYPAMIERAAEWTAGVQAAIDEFGVPWQVTQLGCRAEYSFRPTPPHDGREAAEADDFALQQYLHLHALNRGILITPFHNMALMSPATTSDDVARHTEAFREAVASLFG
ncbi:MAG: aminotransferase class III-fold pyridoxal phosphate-dependent enzyme [Actinomycetales bacterium]|nr:aminotransferase class III-fold pyridoxal phosphate-dependent enzyme [Actinomycetales bacterium]